MLTMAFTAVLAATAALQTATDTTFAVRAGTRIELRDVRGGVTVEAWDRNEVRVRADHGSRDRIVVVDRGGVVAVRATRDIGMPVAVDYRLSVPRGVALTLSGLEGDFDVTGVRGDVRIESIEGDIVLRDVGAVFANTVDGDITVRGAQGNLRLSTTDGDLTLEDIRGDIGANTLDGEILMDRIEALNVDVSTVDGDIRYDGVMRDGGRYRLSTHDGDITLMVPAGINATVTVATFDGDFESVFPVQIQPGAHRGHRFSFTVGNGSAQVELESFDGAIRLVNR